MAFWFFKKRSEELLEQEEDTSDDTDLETETEKVTSTFRTAFSSFYSRYLSNGGCPEELADRLGTSTSDLRYYIGNPAVLTLEDIIKYLLVLDVPFVIKMGSKAVDLETNNDQG